MSLRKIETVPVIKPQDLYEYLSPNEPFDTWHERIFNDSRFIAGFDFWGHNNQILLGMHMAKRLSLDEQTVRGQKAYDHFCEFRELRGSYEILSTREATPTNNPQPQSVERPKLTAV